MKTRTLLLTAILFIGFSFNNCTDPFDCGDFGPVPEFFDITDVHLTHMSSKEGFIQSESIDYDDYGSLNLIFIVDYIATISEKNGFNFSLMNQAYSCSPPEAGTRGSKEEAIENITVITLNDYDDEHMANDTINDILSVGYDYQKNVIFALDNFLNDITTNVEDELIALYLQSRPTLSQEFQVRILIDLSNGERYEAVSDPITFT